MSIYVNDCNKVNDIFINVNGKKKVNSCWVNKSGNPTKVFSTGNKIYDFSTITWANGSDEEIAAMLDAHYAGLIDIHDYWHVGDERVVHLSAMEFGAVSETHVEQDVTMVLMNEGGKTLVKPINGKAECAFIVGQKKCLAELGYMNFYDTCEGGWDSCLRRMWCNETYRNALPAAIKPLFRQFNNVTATGCWSKKKTSADYFALASEKEIFGSVTYANATAEADNAQFDYYKTSANRVNKAGEFHWWQRSPHSIDDIPKNFCIVHVDGFAFYSWANRELGIAPFGCI